MWEIAFVCSGLSQELKLTERNIIFENRTVFYCVLTVNYYAERRVILTFKENNFYFNLVISVKPR